MLVMSNELHNQHSDHLVVVLATEVNVEQVRSPLEIYCEIGKRKIKILASRFFTIDKEIFFKLESYLGKLDEETMQKVNDKIKLILDLS